MATSSKKLALLAVKLIVSVTVLGLVLRKAGWQQVLGLLVSINPWAFAGAVGIYLLGQLASSYRWQLLLPDPHPIGRLYGLYLLGSFFNTFLPGIVGGDAVKVYYLYRDTGKGVQSLASVFMDRYIGLTALLAMGLSALPFAAGALAGSWALWLLPVMAVGFSVVSLVVFGMRIGGNYKPLTQGYEYFHSYSQRRSVIVRAFGLSLIVQAAVVLAVYVLARGLGLTPPFMMMFVFVPIVSALSAMPVSISGLGIREASMVMVLGTLGITAEAATAVSFAWFLSMAVAGCFGLPAYFKQREVSRA